VGERGGGGKEGYYYEKEWRHFNVIHRVISSDANIEHL
jgi:hypothetical protein